MLSGVSGLDIGTGLQYASHSGWPAVMAVSKREQTPACTVC